MTTTVCCLRGRRVLIASLLVLSVCTRTSALVEDDSSASGFITYDVMRGQPYNVTYDGRRAVCTRAHHVADVVLMNNSGVYAGR